MTTPTLPISSLPFFAITFAISWLCWVPAILLSRFVVESTLSQHVLIGMGGIGPSIAAVFLSYRAESIVGVRRLLGRGLKLRFAFRDWLLILMLPPLITIASAALFATYSIGASASELLSRPWEIAGYLAYLLAGAALEEFGWRGYAQSILAARGSELSASIVVGIAWATWHLPLFLIPGSGQSQLSLPAYYTMTVAATVVMGDLLRRTGGSVAAVSIFHAVMNLSFIVFSPLGSDASDQRMFWCVAILYFVAAIVVVATSRRMTGTELDAT